MGDKTPATTTQNQTTSSQTDPWSAATPLLTDLINKYSSLNTAPTSAQTTATNNLVGATSNLPSFAQPAANATTGLFDNAGMLKSGYNTVTGNLMPIATSSANPYDTPGFSDALHTLNQDITNQVKGQYAAAGRDPSGAGSMPQTLARGLSQGEGQLIANQYNSNIGNILAANSGILNAGTGTTGALDANTQSALTAAGLQPTIAAAPATAQVQAANTQQALPYQNLLEQLQAAGLLGGMGSSSTSTGTAVGTQTPANNPLMNWVGGTTAGLGLVGSFLSDERAKDDVEEVGELHDGQKVYRFRMKGDPRHQIGLLAQEVEKKRPEAVYQGPGGMKMVNYKAATRFAGAGMAKAA